LSTEFCFKRQVSPTICLFSLAQRAKDINIDAEEALRLNFDKLKWHKLDLFPRNRHNAGLFLEKD
jgi:hypothetical protein